MLEEQHEDQVSGMSVCQIGNTVTEMKTETDTDTDEMEVVRLI